MSSILRRWRQQSLKESLLELPLLLCLWLNKRKTSPFGGFRLDSPATNIPLAGLSEEEQLALAIKASIDTIREEREARVANLIMTVPQVLGLLSLILFSMWSITCLNSSPNVCIPMTFCSRSSTRRN